MSNILYPVQKYTHEGFPPPTPPNAWAAADGAGGGRHGVGSGGKGGIPYGYISILDKGYWILRSLSVSLSLSLFLSLPLYI